VDYLSHGISPLPQSTEESGEETATETLEEGAEARSSALESFTSNLNDRAREGKIDPLIGRESEVQSTIQILV